MTLGGRRGGGRRRPEGALARLAFLSALAAVCAALSCAKPAPIPWNGEYSGVSAGSEANRASLAIGEAGKGAFLFSLALAKENGYTRDLSGKAAFKGRVAAYSGEGCELSFALGEGSDPGIVVETKGPSLESEGLAMRIRLERRTAGEETAATPYPAVSPGTDTGHFRFGYYLPEGAETDALPESLDFIFFEREGMKAREIRMFEGMSDQGKDLGRFTLESGSIRLTGKDPKTGKKTERTWKREAGGAIVSDTGQRYFFWKDNLGE